MTKIPVNTIRVGDIDVAYEVSDHTQPWAGREPETVLLHHGYSRNMKFWQPWVSRLSGKYRVVRFDSRGCGDTTVPPLDWVCTGNQIADDAVRLLDALDIERVHWIGESSGGIYGMIAALAHPDRFRSLTGLDTPLRIPDKVLGRYTLGERDQAAAIEKYGVGGWCRKTLDYRLDIGHASQSLQDWYVAEMDRTPRHVAIAYYRLVQDADLSQRAAALDIPIMVLAGEKSPIADKDNIAKAGASMRNTRVVTIPGYGHGISMVAPDECVKEIEKFWASLR